MCLSKAALLDMMTDLEGLQLIKENVSFVDLAADEVDEMRSGLSGN